MSSSRTPVRDWSEEQRREHTAPARRAVKLKVATRKISEIVAEPLLTSECLRSFAATIEAEAEARSAQAKTVRR